MPVTHIPQHVLDRERRQAERFAASAAPKTEMRGGDGVVLRRIPINAYLNATSVHGESPADEGYWKDMERKYPEIKVPYVSRRVSVARRRPGVMDGSGKLTRFGRVTFHKRYSVQ